MARVAVFGGAALRKQLQGTQGARLRYEFFPLPPPRRVELDGFDGALVEIGERTQRRTLTALRGRIEEKPIGSVARRFDASALKRSRTLGFDFHVCCRRAGEPSAAELLAHLEAAGLDRDERWSLRSRLARTRKRLDILTDIVKTANSILEPRKIIELVMGQIERLVPAEAWSILMVDESRQALRFEQALGSKAPDVAALQVRVGEGIAGWVAETGRPAIVNDVRRDPRFAGRFDTETAFRTRSILCVPLVSRGRTIGVVQALNRREGRFSDADLESLLTLVEPCAIALENAMLFQKAEQLTITDDLTQLFNSRYLNLYMTREIKRCKRHGTPLSVIFLDLDGFKGVNDRHGHLAGSATLTEVGQILTQAVRESDILARYGGDEFVAVLPETPASGALVIAERIRQAIEEFAFLRGQGLEVHISASFGIASYPEHGLVPEALIQKADQAMYRVKEQNKNGILLAI